MDPLNGNVDAKRRRQTLALRSLSRVPPSSAEAADLHAMYLQYGQDNDPSSTYERVWMGDTHLEKTMLMFPQERKLVFFPKFSSSFHLISEVSTRKFLEVIISDYASARY